MKTVAIAGIGLIGASFGLALRKAGFEGEILGISSAAAVEAGILMGAISRSASLEEAASTAELIYLAQPVDRILTSIEALGRMELDGIVITDAGSTKAAIVEKARRCIRSAVFIGGHPMAGKEQRGAQYADADLFRGRPYVLTPATREHAAGTEFRSWLERIGANVIEMDAEHHDNVVAYTSHLPQLISTALALTVAANNDASVEKIFGPGLLDMTRLALSSPELWESILMTNQQQVAAAIDSFVAQLTQIRSTIGTDRTANYFYSAAQFSRKIRDTVPG